MAKNNYYVEGNTARQVQAMPVPERRSDYEREQRKNKRKEKKLQHVLAFDLKYTLMLVISLGAMAYACSMMLSAQATLQAQKKELAALTESYENLQNANDAKVAKMRDSLDLNYIFNVATNELGMVYPKSGQVLTYESTKEQYVKQYKDVPKLD